MQSPTLKPYLKEMMTCTLCGFCKGVCPSFAELGWDPASARGRMLLAYGLLQKEIEPDTSVINALYQCTTCNDCYRKCPSKIKVVEVVEGARKDLVANRFGLEQHERIAETIKTTGNPFGEKKVDEGVKKADIGYFMGCLARYRQREIADATLSILNKLGANYTVLNEVCCGSVLQRTGWDRDFKGLVEQNLRRIKEAEVKRVIFSCAGCYRMFKLEYPKRAKFDFEPLHITEWLSQQNLKLKEFKKKITYHDPCHLGRHAKVYEPPRKILTSILGAEFREMEKNREEARCCGAGGGVKSAFPNVAEGIGRNRLEEAKFADYLVTSCPFCVSNLKSIEEKAKTGIAVMDISVLVDSLL